MKKSAKRLKSEKDIFELLNTFDSSGYNSKMYKDIFNNMSETKFTEFMKKIVSEEEFLTFEIDSKNDSDLELSKIFKKCKKLGIPTHQHVIYKENNTVSEYPVMIMYVPTKRLQQMAQKKNSATSDTNKINPLLGTVTGDSKSAGINDTQTFGLITTNQTNAIKELMGPRADDSRSKMQMMSRIEEYGEVSIKDLDIQTKNKQSINTMIVFLRSAGLQVEFDK